MRADPEPKVGVNRFNSQGAIAQADADGPISPDLFELERRMARIALEQLEIGVGQFLN
jgi:hypothetical protein